MHIPEKIYADWPQFVQFVASPPGDAFATMTTPRSYRPSMIGGALVRLNTGAVGRVIEPTGVPLKPRIRLVPDPAGRYATGRRRRY
jgi:hypothetical protein